MTDTETNEKKQLSKLKKIKGEKNDSVNLENF